MSTTTRDDANLLYAFVQVVDRVMNNWTPENVEALIRTLTKREDSLDKVRLLQAVELLTKNVCTELIKVCGYTAESHRAYLLVRDTQSQCRQNWTRLYGERTPMPSADDHWSLLGGFMDDAELMGILGLQAGRPSDVKQIDPNIDFIDDADLSKLLGMPVGDCAPGLKQVTPTLDGLFHGVMDNWTPENMNIWTPQSIWAVIEALTKREDNITKVQLLEVVEAIMKKACPELVKLYGYGYEFSQAQTIASRANIYRYQAWTRLYGEGTPMPSDEDRHHWVLMDFPNVAEPTGLMDFVNDAELMGILGLQAVGHAPQLKQTDSGLDQGNASALGL